MRLQGKGELKTQVQCRFLTGRQYLDGQRANVIKKDAYEGRRDRKRHRGLVGFGEQWE